MPIRSYDPTISGSAGAIRLNWYCVVDIWKTPRICQWRAPIQDYLEGNRIS